jgi:hypothetical protein
MWRQICWRTRIGTVVAAAACLSLGSVTAQRSSASLLHVMKPAGYIAAGHGSLGCGDHACYTPAQLRQAYDFPRNLDGTGQTIVVVVGCGGSPTIGDDLAQFDSAFGIPAPPSFTTVPQGITPNCDPGAQINWGVETSSGVELAHAMAPGASIVLAVSATDNVSDIVATEQQVLPQYPGAIVAQAFGDDETDPTAQTDFATLHDVFTAAVATGDSIVASAGDFGASDGGPTAVAAYPASDPLVTGVGGTEGDPYPDGLLKHDGKYGREQVWNESMFPAATGGAPSVLFPTPDYQQGVTGVSGRAVPDVAYNAAINGGVQIYYGPFGFITFGGTSAGVPQWAAILALADQARSTAGQDPLGAANAALYAIARSDKSYRHDFNDIRKGNNALLPGLPGFKADHGYDLATGLGTPDVANLVPDLVNVPVPPQPKPSDMTCSNQQLTGTYHDVSVASGAWCDLAGATVLGDVHASYASGLGITGSSIAGDVDADHVGGAADPFHAGANVVCNSTIAHDLSVHDSAAGTSWAIGGAGCANVVGHDLRFVNNIAGGDLSANAIRHDLDCHDDGPVTDTGGANSVGGHASGQCAALAVAAASGRVTPTG